MLLNGVVSVIVVGKWDTVQTVVCSGIFSRRGNVDEDDLVEWTKVGGHG